MVQYQLGPVKVELTKLNTTTRRPKTPGPESSTKSRKPQIALSSRRGLYIRVGRYAAAIALLLRCNVGRTGVFGVKPEFRASRVLGFRRTWDSVGKVWELAGPVLPSVLMYQGLEFRVPAGRPRRRRLQLLQLLLLLLPIFPPPVLPLSIATTGAASRAACTTGARSETQRLGRLRCRARKFSHGQVRASLFEASFWMSTCCANPVLGCSRYRSFKKRGLHTQTVEQCLSHASR